MMRRPPTRIELRTDDIAEYDEIMKARKMTAAASSADTQVREGVHTQTHGQGVAKRKLNAAERIDARK